MALGQEAHVNTSLKHFVFFIKEFDLIDKDKSGELDENELKAYYPDFTIDQIKAAVAAADTDGDSKVDPPEFTRFKANLYKQDPMEDRR